MRASPIQTRLKNTMVAVQLRPIILVCRSPADKGGAGVNITIPVVGVPASVGAKILRSKRIDLMWDADELPVSGKQKLGRVNGKICAFIAPVHTV